MTPQLQGKSTRNKNPIKSLLNILNVVIQTVLTYKIKNSFWREKRGNHNKQHTQNSIIPLLSQCGKVHKEQQKFQSFLLSTPKSNSFTNISKIANISRFHCQSFNYYMQYSIFYSKCYLGVLQRLPQPPPWHAFFLLAIYKRWAQPHKHSKSKNFGLVGQMAYGWSCWLI